MTASIRMRVRAVPVVDPRGLILREGPDGGGPRRDSLRDRRFLSLRVDRNTRSRIWVDKNRRSRMKPRGKASGGEDGEEGRGFLTWPYREEGETRARGCPHKSCEIGVFCPREAAPGRLTPGPGPGAGRRARARRRRDGRRSPTADGRRACEIGVFCPREAAPGRLTPGPGPGAGRRARARRRRDGRRSPTADGRRAGAGCYTSGYGTHQDQLERALRRRAC